ncbi:cytochrome P450 [Trinickia terrae]|uniref:Cytochrome P450 n=1 Tax=Trinickia terrae TaxID=2571161 RepID=A0A4U1HZE0_9BURK|nr:cytochrome P450 [Trinickia terrae]TKC86247.1 cytochrome P450 [Trinickia terrae]
MDVASDDNSMNSLKSDALDAPIPHAPWRLPILGHSVQLFTDPLPFVEKLAQIGSLVRVDLGRLPMLLITDPDLTHQVLQDSRTFDKGGPLTDKMRELASNSLLTSRYDDHKVQRKLMQPAFSRTRIAGYASEMNQAIDAVIGHWQEGDVVEITAACYEIAARSASRTMFAANVTGAATASVVEDLTTYLGGLFIRLMVPSRLMRLLPTPANVRYNGAMRRLHMTIDRMIDAYRQSGVDHGDLLSMMLAARDENGEPWTHKEIHEQVLTMFLAGIETTASVMGWTIYLISQHPDFAERVAAQVIDTVGDAEPQADHFPKLSEIRCAVMETLRLYPPAWLSTRVVTRETTLGKYRLRAGDAVAYSPYVLQRNPALFEAPERFAPERWLPENAKSMSSRSFIPFGGGVFKCIGDQFGVMEVTLTLAKILSRWRLSPVTKDRVRPVPRRALLAPNKFEIRLAAR